MLSSQCQCLVAVTSKCFFHQSQEVELNFNTSEANLWFPVFAKQPTPQYVTAISHFDRQSRPIIPDMVESGVSKVIAESRKKGTIETVHMATALSKAAPGSGQDIV
jgi:hypothetical protein